MSGATAEAGVSTFDHPIAGAVVPPGPGPSKQTTASMTTLHKQQARQPQQASTMAGVMGSLRVIELQLVAFIMVFSASGLVPLTDLAFPAFATLYFLALSRLAFPSLPTGTSGTSSASSIYDAGSGALFRLYVVLGTVVGLFLPLAYVLGGFARGDDAAVRAAAPHLFLLALQILTENAVSGLGLFSPPVRALVPTVYTIRRVFVVLDWAKDAWLNKTLPANAAVKDAAWLWFGKGLAVANLVYFCSNLLCFLIPCFLPRAFERYFRDRNELHAKTAEDRRSAASSSANASKDAARTKEANNKSD